MLTHFGVLAQSTTVTVREAWSTPRSTTYWINTNSSTPMYTLPRIDRATPSSNWMNVHAPTQVKGDSGYEKLIDETTTLFYKNDKTPSEYDKLRYYAASWRMLYDTPKDERLREFYRFHNLEGIFGDKPASILEDY